ncbi:hypothetical protein HOP50_08g51320 [Chloropicon primus]|uniref:EF-hand domain-containing protein n=1 Tax=Chloropicon primus TaxID=1764295 RepID=A0A5B8MPI7_9CHLO|nr:hypothetical protein A3770_08p51060 [Chloropicon primus]UPR01810.1 hypothetical protein HOP50_08g51320 [Chloropicon primus]|eukprot:QDZ22588.1 hypothetical protein A3770_08p51060 [Chloropicon primus]
MAEEASVEKGEGVVEGGGEGQDDVLLSIFGNYESDVKGKMLTKYLGKALSEAGLDLPEAEVRDLTFIADRSSCGWVKKEDFIRVANVARDQKSDAEKLKDMLVSQYKSSSLSVEDLTELLQQANGFEAKSVEGEEWNQVLESLQQTDSYQKDGKVDAEDLIRVLMHPGLKSTDSPLDSLSINLSQ